MITAHDSIIDQFAPTVESGKRLTTWYAQGHSDGLGDRLLMFDNTSAPSWEILRFKPALARDPRFEAALRQRVERLSSFQHPAFPLVRPIKKLGHEDGLAVVSTYASGASLSEALKKPRSAEFSVRLMRQLVPALAALRQHAPDAAHGVLNADRIILTADGRLMIREHMVGSALESLELSPARLWTEFGVLVPSTMAATPALDDRSDLTQLALVALSLMAGRRIGPDEYPHKVRELFEEIASKSIWQGPTMFQSLRDWLERALQLGSRPFDSVRDAEGALADLQDEPGRGEDPFEATVRRVSEAGSAALAQLPPAKEPEPSQDPPMWAAARGLRTSDDARAGLAVRALAFWRRVPHANRWLVAAVGVVALGEAAFIGQLLYTGSAARTAVDTNSVIAAAPASVPPSPAVPLPVVMVATVDQKLSGVQTTAIDKQLPVRSTGNLPDLVQTSVAARRGGFRVSAPVDVSVLEGERVVGSSADGPIIVAAGRHEFDFVNNAIGFRARRVIDVKPGQITSLPVVVPNGSLNINATPWASVWIDGMPYGETPLGNVSVLPGEHEIILRHPELGERREKAFVRSDVLTRVGVNLQR